MHKIGSPRITPHNAAVVTQHSRSSSSGSTHSLQLKLPSSDVWDAVGPTPCDPTVRDRRRWAGTGAGLSSLSTTWTITGLSRHLAYHGAAARPVPWGQVTPVPPSPPRTRNPTARITRGERGFAGATSTDEPITGGTVTVIGSESDCWWPLVATAAGTR